MLMSPGKPKNKYNILADDLYNGDVILCSYTVMHAKVMPFNLNMPQGLKRHDHNFGKTCLSDFNVYNASGMNF